MPQKMLLGNRTHSFVSGGTLKMMSQVGVKMAIARRAVVEIRKIEDMLAVSGNDEKVFKQAMIDKASMARLAAKSAAEAVGILKDMFQIIEAYFRDVEVERNAAN